VSGAVSSGRAAGELAGAAGPPGAGGDRRGAGRRWAAAALAALLVAAGVAGAVISGVFGDSGSPGGGAASSGYKTSTATVKRQTLTSQATVNATLGYAGSYTVTGKGGGTLTWLPAEGRVIRQGQVLYRVDNRVPVYLLYGKVPAWRALAAGMTGQDVAQLNHDLVRLGYASSADIAALGWDYFGWDTRYALQQLQAALGITNPTGTLPLGQAVFQPSAIRVNTVPASLGNPASGPILTASSARRAVTINLDASEQDEVTPGDEVSITLPDGTNTPGVISSVGKVASTSSSGATTVTVQVRLRQPKAAGDLDQAPVTVTITTVSVSNVLVVPVDALLAQPPGGYAVEVTGPGGHHLVTVTTGLFDDDAGLVQVSGAGLAAGQHVVVPAI
jgi:multidrug efflux pump subunit AcrA (membrane-fusion protein)